MHVLEARTLQAPLPPTARGAWSKALGLEVRDNIVFFGPSWRRTDVAGEGPGPFAETRPPRSTGR
jgi:hypothetical protein